MICGGVGSKMWPMSRSSLPKHFLPLVKGQSLFELNYQALLTAFRPDQIYVQTTVDQAGLVKQNAPDIPIQNIFLEPELRNHGPATGFMAARLFKEDPDEPFILVQTDVIRSPTSKFIDSILACENLIKEEKKLITGGFRPDFPVMGVDYLVPDPQSQTRNSVKIFKMKKWLGRDSKEQTTKFLKENICFLHANQYAWTPRLMLEAYKRHRPDWYTHLQKIMSAFDKAREEETIKEEYSKMTPGPVEEVTSHELAQGYVFELPFKWIDFGTWESVEKYLKEKDLYQPKNEISLDSKDNFAKLPSNKTLALIGVEDLIIIDTPDALLICRRDQSGRVGEIVKTLKDQNKKSLL